MEAGAGEADRQALLSTSDVVLSVQPPRLEALAAHGVTALSLVLLPRTSRAQSMDVLSSQIERTLDGGNLRGTAKAV